MGNKRTEIILSLIAFFLLFLAISGCEKWGCGKSKKPSYKTDLTKSVGATKMKVWNKSFGAHDTEESYGMKQTSSGEYIVAGSTGSVGAGLADFWVFKLDEDGNKIWDKTFGGKERDQALCVDETKDGGYIVGGVTGSFGPGDAQAWVIKLDKDGNKVWEKFFGGPNSDAVRSIKQTKDGGFVVLEITSLGKIAPPPEKKDMRPNIPRINWDVRVRKLDKDGEQVWEKRFGGEKAEWAFSIRETEDGGYIFAGRTESLQKPVEEKLRIEDRSESEESDFWVVKLDANGNKVWEKTFGGDSKDSAYDVALTDDGGYVVAGETGSYGAGQYDFWVIKLDKNGKKQWDKTYGGDKSDSAHSIQQTRDGGYIVGGLTFSYGAGNADFYIIKLDKDGNKIWDKVFGGAGNDEGWYVQQTMDGGYIMSGRTECAGGGVWDIWVLKLDENGNTATSFAPKK